MKNEMCVWPAETNFKNLKNRTFASPPHCWDLAISFKMAKWACSSQEKQKCWWLQNRVRELNLEMGGPTCQLNIWPSVLKFNIYHISNLKIVIFALYGFSTLIITHYTKEPKIWNELSLYLSLYDIVKQRLKIL